MQLTIAIPFRPSYGGLTSPNSPLRQREDLHWVYTKDGEEHIWGRHPNDDLYRCLKSLQKNSFYKHDIVVVIDSDLSLNEEKIKEFGDNIRIFRADNSDCHSGQAKQITALNQLAESMDDNDMLGQCFIADCVASKNWDISLIKLIERFGDNHVYVPMFVEARTEKSRANINLYSISSPEQEKNRISFDDEVKSMSQQTTDNIWNKWRKTICCHSLTIRPIEGRYYFTEKDMDDFVVTAKGFNKEYIEEPLGSRDYGYWSPLCAKSIKFKQTFKNMPMSTGWDLYLDNNIPVKSKIVDTKSFVFHFHSQLHLDDIEVEHNPEQ